MRASIENRNAVGIAREDVMSDAISQFREALTARGIVPPDELIADGVIHRCDVDGKKGKGDASYLFHLDGIPAGGFENWCDGQRWQNWRADIGRALTPSEEAAHRERVEAARKQRQADEAKRHEEARKLCAYTWNQSKPVTPESPHPYLVKKMVFPYGLKVTGNGRLIIPMRDASGTLHSLQFIDADGRKRFKTGGRKHGCYFTIGKPNGVLCVCEGYATGASIHEVTGHAVAVAFDAGNLKAVALALREKLPEVRIILCADDDFRTEGNPGCAKAIEAARAVNGMIAYPVFGEERSAEDTDFNDMFNKHGAEAVARAIADAFDPSEGEVPPGHENAPAGDSDGTGWPDPHPLAAKIEPEDYPLDSLPDTLRAAVEEVGGFVKAPVPLVASSALAALSLACQAHIDIKRAEKLSGPSGLFLLTIADSGERKSTCDSLFTSAIRKYQDEQIEAMKPALKEHQAAMAAWEAEREGLLASIREAGKKGRSTEDLRANLSHLQHEEPEPPRVPRLVLGDETPESLAWSLAKKWPSAGILASEAGIVFGSHGMGKDSIMRNLSMLNVLWDGGTHSVGRRTSESFEVRGARLTVALQVQEPTLREFFASSGALARGTGFLARFLVAWPESTQGNRPFTEAPENWPHLAAFHRRISEILNQPAPIDESGVLAPAVLTLTPEAKTAWIEFHDAIESELKSGGELFDVRDVASKSADNAARLGALFQMFEHGTGDAVGADCFERARRIVAWHLSESRRFFGELALPVELADAARLDSWLIAHCQRERTYMVGKNHVRRYGPLREKERLDSAIRELAELDHLRLEKDGKRLTIHLNPALAGMAR
jgi:putative DNA primase/helicase